MIVRLETGEAWVLDKVLCWNWLDGGLWIMFQSGHRLRIPPNHSPSPITVERHLVELFSPELTRLI